jgi:hypothetical protein
LLSPLGASTIKIPSYEGIFIGCSASWKLFTQSIGGQSSLI